MQKKRNERLVNVMKHINVRKEKKALKLNVLRGLEPSFKETRNRKRQSEDKLENTKKRAKRMLLTLHCFLPLY